MQNRVAWGVARSCGIARRRTIPKGRVVASNARRAGVFDRNPERNAEVARAFGATAYSCLEALLAAVATPIFANGAIGAGDSYCPNCFRYKSMIASS